MGQKGAIMKLTLACALLVFAVAASIQPDHALAADQTEVAFIPHDKTQAALDNKADIHLLLADDVAVEGNYRNKPGNPELHTKQTNIFYITDGSATIVAGGKYQGGKEISPGQVRGGTIDGGAVYDLVKGDTIVIPAGSPVWFKEVPSTVSYYVVKITKRSPG
jgi:mannose-6-phosphate isomerase-like protein (cupin superfamily)